jgi:succinate dehydrogenase / fumarate reductase, cytochrome b subunit
MAAGKRPLSPHLQIYRPQWTTVLSISHRFTGLALALSFPLLVYWLVALASGDAAYATALGWFGAWPVKLVLFAASFAFSTTSPMAYGISPGIPAAASSSPRPTPPGSRS